MKNINKFLVLMLATVLLSGCNSLDQNPSDAFSEDEFWQSAERAQMFLNTAYSGMYSIDNMWSDEVLAGNMISKRDRSWDEYLIRAGQGTSSTTLFSSHWSWIYSGIKTTNIFIEKVELTTDLTEEERADMVAQARFIRANHYFRATMLWGAVPFFLHDITIDEAAAMPRTDRSEVLAALHTELDEIIDALPVDWQTDTRGRIRRVAAVMLQARIYLFESNWSKVEELTSEIINGEHGTFELFNTTTPTYSAYEDLFTSANEYNNEIILCYSSIENLSTWQLIDVVPRSVVGSRGAYVTPTEKLVENYIMLDGSSFSLSSGSAYDNRDPRLDATIVRHNSVWKDIADGKETEQTIVINSTNSDDIDRYEADNATETGYYLRKWFDPAHTSSLTISTNPIMMRYADVLLMNAEAKNENGTFTESDWNQTIQAIRLRAGFTQSSALTFPSLSKDEMREVIRVERRSELAVEGLYYYDILRWKAADTQLSGTLYSAKYDASTSQEAIFQYNFDTNRDYLWAVPQSQISNWEALLPQNPGY